MKKRDYPSCRAIYTIIYSYSLLKPIKLWALKDHTLKTKKEKRKRIIQTLWRARRYHIDHHIVIKVNTRLHSLIIRYYLLPCLVFPYNIISHTLSTRHYFVCHLTLPILASLPPLSLEGFKWWTLSFKTKTHIICYKARVYSLWTNLILVNNHLPKKLLKNSIFQI